MPYVEIILLSILCGCCCIWWRKLWAVDIDNAFSMCIIIIHHNCFWFCIAILIKAQRDVMTEYRGMRMKCWGASKPGDRGASMNILKIVKKDSISRIHISVQIFNMIFTLRAYLRFHTNSNLHPQHRLSWELKSMEEVCNIVICKSKVQISI